MIVAMYRIVLECLFVYIILCAILQGVLIDVGKFKIINSKHLLPGICALVTAGIRIFCSNINGMALLTAVTAIIYFLILLIICGKLA